MDSAEDSCNIFLLLHPKISYNLHNIVLFISIALVLFGELSIKITVQSYLSLSPIDRGCAIPRSYEAMKGEVFI